MIEEKTGLPNLENTRRELVAKRRAVGAETAFGHRCSNLLEQLENYAKADNEDQRANLEKAIRRQMADLAGLHQ